MVLIVHATPRRNLKSILKAGAIQSVATTKKCKGGFAGCTEYENPDLVYAMVLFDFFEIAIPDDAKMVYLFFDTTVFEKNKPLHYCDRWLYGKFNEDYCEKYKRTVPIDAQLDEWSESYVRHNRLVFPVKGRDEFVTEDENIFRYIYGPTNAPTSPMNEVVFAHEIKLDSLVGIYAPGLESDPLLMTTQKEIKMFLKRYGLHFDADTYKLPKYSPSTFEKYIKALHNLIERLKKKKFKSRVLADWARHSPPDIRRTQMPSQITVKSNSRVGTRRISSIQ